MRYLSPSALNKLMDDPRQYKKKYIDFDEEKTLPSDQVVLGSLIHSLLASEPWEEKFLIPGWEVPSDKIQDILYCYWANTYSKAANTELSSFEPSFEDDGSPASIKILSLMKAFGYNQHLKTDASRLKGFVKDSKGQPKNGDKYFEHLKKYKSKVALITDEDLSVANKINENIRKNPRLCELINFEHSAFEKELKCELNPHFGLKGILDNHWADLGKEQLYINDFKTSEKLIRMYYKDLRWDNAVHNQVAQYEHLLLENPEYKDFQVHRHIIYINQLTGDVYPFEVGDDVFTQWQNYWKSDIRKAVWHFENNSFELPYDYQNNLVSLRYEPAKI